MKSLTSERAHMYNAIKSNLRKGSFAKRNALICLLRNYNYVISQYD